MGLMPGYYFLMFCMGIASNFFHPELAAAAAAAAAAAVAAAAAAAADSDLR